MQGRNRCADVKNELVDTARGWGWGDKLTDSVDIYTVLWIKLIASGKLLYNTGSSARCSVMT